jgi:hypothetical protein
MSWTWAYNDIRMWKEPCCICHTRFKRDELEVIDGEKYCTECAPIFQDWAEKENDNKE